MWSTIPSMWRFQTSRRCSFFIVHVHAYGYLVRIDNWCMCIRVWFDPSVALGAPVARPFLGDAMERGQVSCLLIVRWRIRAISTNRKAKCWEEHFKKHPDGWSIKTVRDTCFV